MGKNSVKLKRGTIYQKEEGGTYYFRYQVNGKRKAVSLKTNSLRTAKKKAAEYMPVVEAPSLEVLAAHVSTANFDVENKSLFLKDAWAAYDEHPEKATPSTVSEQQAYELTWREFVAWINDEQISLAEITPDHAVKYAGQLRAQEIAVDTHNRKIRRLRKVFSTLAEYRRNGNPFIGKGLLRKAREEQNGVRRLGFSKEEEEKLLEVLADKEHKVKNKLELRVLYHLGMYTGQRLKDCALLQWSHVDFNRQRIWVKQCKTGKEVTLPIAKPLLKILEEAKEWKRNSYVLPAVAERYLTKDKNGKNIGANLLNIDVLRVIKWIGLEPSQKVSGRKKKVTVYGFHSLRHSFASHCAEAGVPKAVAQSILGADSHIIDKYYVHVGEDAQLKAMEAVGPKAAVSETAQERIDKALEMISQMTSKSQEVAALEKILKGDK